MSQAGHVAAVRRSSIGVRAAHVESKIRTRPPLGKITSNRLSASNLKQAMPEGRHEAAPQPVSQKALPQFHFDNIQLGNPSDPMDVTDYEGVIYRTMRQREIIAPEIKMNQVEVTLRDRNLLVDAICRFHYKLGLTTSGFYRFVGILDRFLTATQVQLKNMKLVGSAALLLASKIEDVQPALSSDIIQLSERNFTAKELFAAEIQIINDIGFDTTFPTPLFFLTQIMRVSGQTKESLLYARYILEICQTSDAFFGAKASLMAAVAVFMTRLVKGDEPWTKELADYCQYSVADLKSYIEVIRKMIIEEDREESRFMRRKYGSELFLGVALLPVPDGLKIN